MKGVDPCREDRFYRLDRSPDALLVTLAGPVLAQEKVKIGVSIPAATHGWTGGVNYWANVTEQRLESTYPNLEFIVVTAGSASEQVNDLEDLIAIHNIDALVILPFESDPLTDPVRYVKETGVFVTVVDRGLAQEGIEDVYVAGTIPPWEGSPESTSPSGSEGEGRSSS